MTDNTERELFEAWFSDDGLSPKAIVRDGDGYKLMQAASAWRIWQARAALAATAPPAQPVSQPPAVQGVPAGYKLVPIEPTQAMCQDGQEKAREWPTFPLRISPIYQAMLAAAPQLGEQG